MRLRWERTPAPLAARLCAHLPWALICGGALAWTACLAPDRLPVVCPVRRLAHVSCPACGSTRVFHEASQGQWRAALARNPPALGAYFLCWAMFLFHGAALMDRRRWTLHMLLSPTLRRVLLGAILIWIFLLWMERLHREATGTEASGPVKTAPDPLR